MRACKTCTGLTELEICPKCKTATTQYWSGYVGVLNPENSEIAKNLNLQNRPAGEYALKVR
jgi:DNA-directed RNA polymerase subunit E"